MLHSYAAAEEGEPLQDPFRRTVFAATDTGKQNMQRR